VKVTFRGQEKQVKADTAGNWQVRLDPLACGDPGTLTVSAANTVTCTNVLVGDVWLGSGQSNMAGGTRGYAKNDTVLAAMVAEAPYPDLRLYRRRWSVATSNTVPRFSALMFAFGQPLQAELGVPVGLIVGAVGGTPSKRWLSPAMVVADAGIQKLIAEKGPLPTREEELAAYEERVAAWEETVKKAEETGQKSRRKPRKPGAIGDLYARYIEPVVPYAIRGVLWDQGEAGTRLGTIDQYTMMGALIRGWRQAWGQGDFPFLYVQKPSGGGCAWDTANPVTRMAEAFTVEPTQPNKVNAGDYRAIHIRIMEHPNTMMVTSSDLGGQTHPVNKSGYGRRACRVALGFVYGRPVEVLGPVYRAHTVENKVVRIQYDHVGKGLAFRHGERLQGFEIAGEDGVYHWGDARIDGETVLVSSDAVPEPVSVRYGWARKHTWANLFNKDGLPALTFGVEGE
jgi:sialate O-acetylesterase